MEWNCGIVCTAIIHCDIAFCMQIPRIELQLNWRNSISGSSTVLRLQYIIVELLYSYKAEYLKFWFINLYKMQLIAFVFPKLLSALTFRYIIVCCQKWYICVYTKEDLKHRTLTQFIEHCSFVVCISKVTMPILRCNIKLGVKYPFNLLLAMYRDSLQKFYTNSLWCTQYN